MSRFLMVLFVSLFSLTAFAQERICSGELFVDEGFAATETLPVKVVFKNPLEARYFGPTTDLIPPKFVDLTFTYEESTGNYFYFKTAMTHGSHSISFHYAPVGDDKIRFIYRGAYDFMFEGVLTCR